MNSIIADQLENYFLSTWIANLGVVPWLLFFAFLLFPIFTFLFDLLSLVTCVRDTITLLQLFSHLRPVNYLRFNFLPSLSSPVKVFISMLALCVTTLSARELQTTEKTTILLSIGEHKEVKFNHLKKFTITNPHVIGHKFKKSKQFIIKGKKLGFTELVVWEENKKLVFQVYVIAKSKQMKILHLAEMLKGMDLDIQLAGPLIIATGEVHEIKNYIFLKGMLNENKNVLIMKARISKNLRNQIIMNIYKRFFDSYEDNIICNSEYLTIVCHVPSHIKNEFYQDLINKYSISFLRIPGSSNQKNYLVNIKFFRILSSSSEEQKPGLSKLNTQLSSMIENNWEKLIEGNKFKLEGMDIYIQEISNHEISTVLNKEASFSTGIEIPYEEYNGTTTLVSKKWKFAGVRIIFDLQKNGSSFNLQYKITKKSPSGGNQFISSTNSSEITLNLNDFYSIFKSKILFFSKDDKLLPYFSKIPLFGSLFKDKTIKNINERIFAYVRISTKN